MKRSLNSRSLSIRKKIKIKKSRKKKVKRERRPRDYFAKFESTRRAVSFVPRVNDPNVLRKSLSIFKQGLENSYDKYSLHQLLDPQTLQNRW